MHQYTTQCLLQQGTTDAVLNRHGASAWETAEERAAHWRGDGDAASTGKRLRSGRRHDQRGGRGDDGARETGRCRGGCEGGAVGTRGAARGV
jgi:hypothetical protein